MNVLRADSGSSPGKARADGKKRQNVLFSHVELLLKDRGVLSVTVCIGTMDRSSSCMLRFFLMVAVVDCI